MDTEPASKTAADIGKGTRRSQRYRPLLWLSFGHGVMHWHSALIPLLYPVLANQFALSFSQLGFLTTARILVGLVASTVGSPFTDAIRRKGPFLVMCLLWAALMFLLLPLGRTYTYLGAVLSLMALGGVLWHPLAMPVVQRLYSGRSGFALGIHGMVAAFAQGLGSLASGIALSLVRWTRVATIQGAVGVAAALLFLLFMPRRTGMAAHADATAVSLREMPGRLRRELVTRRLALISIVSSMKTGSEAGVLTFVPMLMSSQFGLNLFWVGVGVGVLSVASSLAQPLVGRAADRFGALATLCPGLAAGAIILFCIPLVESPLALLALLILLALSLFSTTPVLFSWAMGSSSADLGGSAVGFVFTMMAPGMVIPPLGGWLADRYGLASAFWLLGLVSLAGLAATLLLIGDDTAIGGHKSRIGGAL